MKSDVFLFGVRISNVSMDETVDIIDGWVGAGVCHQIATANLDFLHKAAEDEHLRDVLSGCRLVLPDGMPLVWVSHLVGTPLQERVTGADLLPRLLDLSSRKKYRIFFLGATEERSLAAVKRMKQEYPEAEICGRLSPPVAALEDMNHQEILDAIELAKPDILLVAFGNPKQERWLHQHRQALTVSVCIGVGASIDFFSGAQARAPHWMQRIGMEWLFRLSSEPRRLAGRYAGDALFLAKALPIELWQTARQRGLGDPAATENAMFDPNLPPTSQAALPAIQ